MSVAAGSGPDSCLKRELRHRLAGDVSLRVGVSDHTREMTPTSAGRARILVVDDEPDVRGLIVSLLERAGHSCATASGAAEARRRLKEAEFDLALCDVTMPGESGIALARSISAAHPLTAIVMVTASADPDLAELALASGAYGYVIKPFRSADLLIAVAAALRRRDDELGARLDRERLQAAVEAQKRDLEQAVRRIERLADALRLSELDTARRLSRAIGLRSRETGEHTERVGRIAELIGERLGLEPERCEAIGAAAQLHDVGKVAIPDSILLHPGGLTPAERRTIQRHTEIGHSVLAGSGGELLDLAAEIALNHHERFDGDGYPRRLARSSIPLAGRIAAVADVFDVITHDRVYQEGKPVEEALEIMSVERGSQFDPEAVDALLVSVDQAAQISAELPDPGSVVSGA
jgi:putative two-component system response regulator